MRTKITFLLRFIKYKILKLIFMPYLKFTELTSSAFLGTHYGGWSVNFDKLDSKSIIYSFGAGEDISFDLELSRKIGATVHIFDPTPKSVIFIKKQNLSKKIKFHEYGLLDTDGYMDFFYPDSEKYTSFSILNKNSEGKTISLPVKKMSTILNELGHDKIDVLKMDIEGAEYQVIDDLSKSQTIPQQILVEFHYKLNLSSLKKLRKYLILLLKMHYRIFWISDSFKEFAFIKGDQV